MKVQPHPEKRNKKKKLNKKKLKEKKNCTR